MQADVVGAAQVPSHVHGDTEHDTPVRVQLAGLHTLRQLIMQLQSSHAMVKLSKTWIGGLTQSMVGHLGNRTGCRVVLE